MTQQQLLSQEDLARLSRQGIAVEEIERQLELYRHPPPKAYLLEPCRPADGIVQISADDQPGYIEEWRQLCRQQRLVKMVPASGAATRMFKDLAAETSDAERRGTSDRPSESVRRFLDSLPQFAFWPNLRPVFERNRLDPARVVRFLLESDGLGYASAPKGLILFHAYRSEPRDALEEQIREGRGYLAADEGKARFHFTVSDSHQRDFLDRIGELRQPLEAELGLELQVDLSTQSPATDTLAVEMDNRPLRDQDGRLVLRQAGHGALLENLQSIDADVIFIKNIDNVAQERLHQTSVYWKRVLAGYFAEVQARIWDLQEALENEPDRRDHLDAAVEFLQNSLAIRIPESVLGSTLEIFRGRLLNRLNRPLRVCGMVRNAGEPGGGPFWLADADGGSSGQIIEAAQVNLSSSQQAKIWTASTHFNPVDLVCGIRDRHGRPYALADFVDPATSFIAEKTLEGHPIKALERPGLWNGSMALWNTAFVEVPTETFTPVKTVFDLLRIEHQP